MRTPTPTGSYIVQGTDVESIRSLVTEQGGTITHELGVISAVAVDLTVAQLASIRNDSGVRRIYGNAPVESAGKPVRADKDTSDDGSTSTDGSDGEMAGSSYTEFPSLVQADVLHDRGIDGWGVGIAIIDSGIYSGPGISQDRYQKKRIKAVYDATTGQTIVEGGKGKSKVSFLEYDNDDNGHGSHVAGVMSSSKLSEIGKYNGIAPAASLIAVKVFDAQGRGTYADVIRGIDWIVANRNSVGIDIINMSLSATPRSHYWDDPLNQAVMAAWDAGIVVVASAGNTGPSAQSIGVPGNVPYVITVGAMTDGYTPADGSDDRLATFSAIGPTYEGFVKPEVVAPGGHVMASMEGTDQIALDYPDFYLGANFFQMSGTSQAAAVVSGIAALILQMEPGISPDAVKCKLMRGAAPAVGADGALAYSVFQQGAGMVNAHDAVYDWTHDCANRGLDIKADLDGTKHFGGRASQHSDGSYYLMGLDGYQWTDSGVDRNGYIWTNGYQWTDGYTWASGYQWTDGRVGADGYQWTDGSIGANGYVWTNGYQWTDGYVRPDGYLWTNALTEAMSINSWVPQE
ncbi:MAG: S8 family peptidase [Woeseiaceae bacterium]|nr:S8 family peptidase [Gammaproteobacteria bacterium]NNK25382.1 S8 family peptidase [Woeseiaceae bacterium]